MKTGHLRAIGFWVIVTFCAAWLVKEVLLPVGAAALYSRRYMALTVECDQAMEAAWYYGQDPRGDRRSQAAQLLVCHEYDKIRKTLLMSGLPEEYLSWLGLKSLELYQRPAEEFAEQHRFTER